MPDYYSDTSNRAVAEILAMSESGVSRLRSSDRLPSVSRMLDIERAFGWSVQSQSAAIAAGRYGDTFNEYLEQYALGLDAPQEL